MTKRRMYEVEVGDGYCGHATNFGNDRETAMRVFRNMKQFQNRVTLKSYNEGYTDMRIIKEYHRF